MSDRTKGILVLIVIAVGLFLALGLEPLINRINTPSTKKEIEEYINNSTLEIFSINEPFLENPVDFNINSRKISEGKVFYPFAFEFYDKKYKKYFKIIVFNYNVNPWNKTTYLDKQTDLLYRNPQFPITFTALVNKDQLNNPDYGTKENPVPIWAQELLVYNNIKIADLDTTATDRESVYFRYNVEAFKPEPELFRESIKTYLIYYMPVEEFKEMFR